MPPDPFFRPARQAPPPLSIPVPPGPPPGPDIIDVRMPPRHRPDLPPQDLARRPCRMCARIRAVFAWRP
jgi:hypothetical protein